MSETRSWDNCRGVGFSTSRSSLTANGRTWTLALVVLLLAAGVIALHSLGTGHHGATTTGPLSHVDMRSAAAAPSPMTSQAGHGAMSEATGIRHADGSGCTGCSLSISEPPRNVAMLDGQGLMAMCLAVISVLVLLLRPAWRGWFRPPQYLWNPSQTATGVHHYGPPAGSVSLSRLCVLRT